MTSVKELIATAKAGVENLSTGEVAAEIASDSVVLVDVREPTETDEGVIPGAILVPRGMLEFHADPETRYHLDVLSTDRRVILYCAAGSRSALAARSLQELGYDNVAHMEGGMTAWIDEQRPVAAGAGMERQTPVG